MAVYAIRLLGRSELKYVIHELFSKAPSVAAVKSRLVGTVFAKLISYDCV